jgi:thiaminase/transcriptional activator TenA
MSENATRAIRGSCTEVLREGCAGVWQALHDHPFVLELAAGTLRPDSFRFYIEQDLFFLPALARAAAIGVARSSDPETMEHFAEELSLAGRHEADKQRELLAGITALGAVDRGGGLEPAPATVAYAGFLISVAARGGSPELMAAFLPCTWSYAEIAVALEGGIAAHPVYEDWVRFFADPGYVALIASRRDTLDALAAGLPGPRRRRLGDIFTMSARLERAFWDMAYRLETWPDREVEVA